MFLESVKLRYKGFLYKKKHRRLFIYFRYLSLPTIKDAQKAVRLNFFFMIILILMMGWLGMVLYTVYAECDPITAKQVKTKDQVLPLLVLHVAGDIPGLPGLFMAGVFSGSLSSVSTGLNSLAAIALRDFVPPKRLEQLSTVQQVTRKEMQ